MTGSEGLRLDRIAIAQGGFRLEADLTVPAGSRAAVIGASGAGKSTLLNAIAGFVPLEQGRILWNGADLAGRSPGERPLSILFQDQNLFPHLTVEDNVALGIAPTLRLSDGDRSRVAGVLDRVGLHGFGPRRPGSLSGGEAGRVALARALVRARPILLLDEPFAALGPAMKRGMLDLVADIAGETGATVLMVSHDPGDARHLCPLAMVVAGGRVSPPVPTGPLLDDPSGALGAYLGK